MCGIAGIVRRRSSGVSVESLGRMAAAIKHRGPDGYGFLVGPQVGFAHVRLSVVDLVAGAQPLTNEDGNVVITYNGEVYNHIELRRELEACGHVFRTHCDTEVLVHGFEEWGPAMVPRLNGQFAFAIYDRAKRTVFLARDRFGVRPLFYAERGGDLLFASEIKAILATGEVDAALDPAGLDEVFTCWAARPPLTCFRRVKSIEPGTYGVWRDGTLTLSRYYELNYEEARHEPADAIERLDELMVSAVDFRMRADVPVGTYLSGGLDSSITCSLAAKVSPFAIRSFSITFDDPRFDEGEYQRVVADAIGSVHSVASMNSHAIADSFRDVVWHAETPLLRTAPVPMYHLAKLTREAGIKVVLTGEGADELFLGYDLFKEVSIRRFCQRRPESTVRPRLFDRLYPGFVGAGTGGDFWRRFFLDAGAPTDPLFSHLPRFLLTSRIKDFYSPEFASAARERDSLSELRAGLPDRFFRWSALNQAAYLEMQTLLSPYLLSSQGDRMGMAHGVEARYPFLDHRLHQFASSLPTSAHLTGLREKHILRRWATRVLPANIRQRRKQPYRAPDATSFFSPTQPEWVKHLLSAESVNQFGVFSAAAVNGLVRRCLSGAASGARENQALLGILSTQLWHELFVNSALSITPLHPRTADVMLVHDDVPVPL